MNRNLSNCEIAIDFNDFNDFNVMLKFVFNVFNEFNVMLKFVSCSFVFPQFTSFHSVFHSFYRLMNSINWPALIVWVFIAQAGRALQR